MNIFAEITIDETGIIAQMDKVKEVGDKFEDEMLKLRGMLTKSNATTKIEDKTAGQ